jgi:hypothetical protein
MEPVNPGAGRPASPDGERERRGYEKPQVRQVRLRPEEAVLGFCKSAGAGPNLGGCTSPTDCSTVGS